LGGCSIPETAEQIGCTERTIYRWRKEPGFRRQLEEGRRQAFEHIAAAVTNAATVAARTLVEIMEDKDAGDHARVRAAVAVLDTVVNLRDLDLADRLDEIKELMKEVRTV
jgi:hypothetical protein